MKTGCLPSFITEKFTPGSLKSFATPGRMPLDYSRATTIKSQPPHFKIPQDFINRNLIRMQYKETEIWKTRLERGTTAAKSWFTFDFFHPEVTNKIPFVTF